MSGDIDQTINVLWERFLTEQRQQAAAYGETLTEVRNGLLAQTNMTAAMPRKGGTIPADERLSEAERQEEEKFKSNYQPKGFLQ